MRPWLLLLLLFLPVLTGCDLIFFDDGFDDDVESVVPRIEETLPDGTQPVLRDGDPPLQFYVAGVDDDSLDLDLEWAVREVPWSEDSFDSIDGTFESSFEISYAEALNEGQQSFEVRFTVTDPEGNQAQNLWFLQLGDVR